MVPIAHALGLSQRRKNEAVTPKLAANAKAARLEERLVKLHKPRYPRNVVGFDVDVVRRVSTAA